MLFTIVASSSINNSAAPHSQARIGEPAPPVQSILTAPFIAAASVDSGNPLSPTFEAWNAVGSFPTIIAEDSPRSPITSKQNCPNSAQSGKVKDPGAGGGSRLIYITFTLPGLFIGSFTPNISELVKLV